MPLGSRWWRYVRMLDEETRRSAIEPFLLAHRAPLRERAVVTLKSAARRLGVYDGVREAVRGARPG